MIYRSLMKLAVVFLQLSTESASDFISTFDPSAHVQPSFSHSRLKDSFHIKLRVLLILIWFDACLDETRL